METDRVPDENHNRLEKEQIRRRRRPWLSGLLTILTPGLGHLYCGQWPQAVAVFLGILLAGNIMYGILLWGALGWIGLVASLFLLLATQLTAIVWAARLAKRTNAEYSLKRYNRWYVYVLVVIAGAFVINWAYPAWGNFEAYRMPAGSMEDTLMVDDYFLADQSAYKDRNPETGDIVIFIYPVDGVTKYVKRCVGLPGDTIQIRNKKLFVNGERYPDPEFSKFIRQQVLSRGPGGRDSRDNFGPFIVPPNSYFMMGDNRDNSQDSRFWGTVHRDLILAKALRIYLSKDLDRIGMLIE